MKLSFYTVQDLVRVRNAISKAMTHNDENKYDAIKIGYESEVVRNKPGLQYINDIREYDVIYYQRISIDNKIHCGRWYDVKLQEGSVDFVERKDLISKLSHPKVFAFDIECTKQPLKLPNAKHDHVMMISWMIDGMGFLIINREVVSEDIEDFEYTPSPEFPGPFHVFNEPDERSVMIRFINEIKRTKPNLFVTFNGDRFDWPFLNDRSKILGVPLEESIGLIGQKDHNGETYTTKYAPHLDAYSWVSRDSYLPQGSQGLKAVTRKLLHYNPLEIDPEEMVRYAIENPRVMSEYSVSDAVATYYLYMKYVHRFIFSLCTILPMNPDDVSRKGTGTLCEALLCIKATHKNIIFPNKKRSSGEKYFEGHLIDTETYVGGHVAAFHSGVYRHDIPIDMKVDINKCKDLLKNLDDILKFVIEVEGESSMDDIENYNAIKESISNQLKMLIADPEKHEVPMIYHVDVSAMYPNIILTNRLTPSSIVDDATCTACIHNDPNNECKRKMDWVWRVNHFTADNEETRRVGNALTKKTFKVNGNQVTFDKLSSLEKLNKKKAEVKSNATNI